MGISSKEEKMETKDYTADIEYKADSAGVGGFEGYASVFGVLDYHNDIVVDGAFTETMKAFKKSGSTMPLLWQHNTGQPVGVINSMRQDEKGLLVSGVFADTEAGRDAREYLRLKAVQKMSIGYRVKKASYDDKKGIRYIEEIELGEVSLVTFPANEKATITSVKADLPKTEREFESLLREIGFSRNAAKSITAGGFKAKAEVGEQDSTVRDAQDASLVAQKLAELSNFIRS